jgi:hypothetical protein
VESRPIYRRFTASVSYDRAAFGEHWRFGCRPEAWSEVEVEPVSDPFAGVDDDPGDPPDYPPQLSDFDAWQEAREE